MSDGWGVLPLGEVCTIKPPKAEARFRLRDNDPVSFVPMEDLGIGVKALIPTRTRALGEVSGSYTYFADGDVLLAKITPCFENGKLGVARGLVNGIGFGSSEFIVLRPGPDLEAEFLYYYLARPSFLEEGARSMTGAVGHKRVAKEFIEAYPVPLPLQSEQRRIVAILDEAFESIAAAKAHADKNLRNAREVFELQRTVIFAEYQRAWPTRVLGEVANVQSGGTPLVSKKEFWGGDVAWYSSGELNDLITSEPDRFISEAGLASSNAKVFPEGSLLVGMYDTAALKMSLLHRPAAFNQAIAGVMPNAVLETEFLFHAINVQKPQLLDLRRGVRQKNLSLGKIKEIVIPLPSLRVQRELVQRLRDAKERNAQLESVYQRKLAALDELKQSLLHQAFSGAL